MSCLSFCGILFLQLLALVMFLWVYDESDVWCRGLTICPLYVGKLFQNLVLYDSWSVRSVPLVTINQITNLFFTKGHLKLKTWSAINVLTTSRVKRKKHPSARIAFNVKTEWSSLSWSMACVGVMVLICFSLPTVHKTCTCHTTLREIHTYVHQWVIRSIDRLQENLYFYKNKYSKCVPEIWKIRKKFTDISKVKSKHKLAKIAVARMLISFFREITPHLIPFWGSVLLCAIRRSMIQTRAVFYFTSFLWHYCCNDINLLMCD